jgi:hypothetical protein
VGFASGVVAAGFGVASTIFAPIQTWLINPGNLSPSHVDGYFHDPALLARVPGVFATLALVYTGMQAAGLLVLCDPPPRRVVLL